MMMLSKNELTGAYICPHCGADLPIEEDYLAHTGRRFSCIHCGAYSSGMETRPGYFGKTTDGKRINCMTEEENRRWLESLNQFEVVIVDGKPDPERRIIPVHDPT